MSQLDLLGAPGASFAEFGDDRTRRYLLGRGQGTTAAWIMLNPSVANEVDNDLTIKKCIGFAKIWGRTGIIVANLFSWIDTNPEGLKTVPDPVGPENDRYILEAAGRAHGLVICAWGDHGALHHRGAQVLALLRGAGYQPKCLGLTKNGFPKHPGRLAYATPLITLTSEMED